MKTILTATLLSVMAMSPPASASTGHDWRWINGTPWYVPSAGLLAYTYTHPDNILTPVQDQTVYTIIGYRNGYFQGRTAGKLGSNEISCMPLVGSVAPEEKIT